MRAVVHAAMARRAILPTLRAYGLSRYGAMPPALLGWKHSKKDRRSRRRAEREDAMAQRRSLNVNGKAVRITIDDPDMPLLYARRDTLALHGPCFGCGLAQCGAVTVHIDGKAVRSCVTPLSSLTAQQKVVTLEGLGTPQRLHPVQRTFIEEQAVQCGSCINGMIMESAAFLAKTKKPTEAQVKEALANNLCRCGAHARIVKAVMRAATAGGRGAMTIHASRRDVLKGGGALVVSFSLSGALGKALAQDVKPVALTEVDSFLAIDRSGVVTLYTGKVDVGTGIATALRQMVADELDVPLNLTKLVQGDTALTPDQGKTWGSLSIQIGGMQLRNAAATAKAALLEEAAKRLDAKKEDLRVGRRGQRRQQTGQLRRTDRWEVVRAQARSHQARRRQG